MSLMPPDATTGAKGVGFISSMFFCWRSNEAVALSTPIWQSIRHGRSQYMAEGSLGACGSHSWGSCRIQCGSVPKQGQPGYRSVQRFAGKAYCSQVSGSIFFHGPMHLLSAHFRSMAGASRTLNAWSWRIPSSTRNISLSRYSKPIHENNDCLQPTGFVQYINLAHPSDNHELQADPCCCSCSSLHCQWITKHGNSPTVGTKACMLCAALTIAFGGKIWQGLEPFLKVTSQVIFGKDSPALKEGRVAVVQSLSGTGATSTKSIDPEYNYNPTSTCGWVCSIMHAGMR